jgi:N-dimethylarginine dimethylaminohydrolase
MTVIPAAYQGPGYIKRRHSLAQELESLQVNSEYKNLTEVVLYSPGDEVHKLSDPNKVQHLSPINQPLLQEQISNYAKKLQSFGITVHSMTGGSSSPPNLMYVRDLFFNTPEGAIVARMASEVRAGEEFYATLELAKNALPIRLTISGKGTFEGADAIWLNSKNLLVGVGARTNLLAYKQIKWTLAQLGIKTHKMAMPKGVQHLLGILQIVDKDLALVRSKKSPSLIPLLKKFKIRAVPIPESTEVTEAQGMNILTLRPREIFMPTNCPNLKKIYQEHKIKILAEIDISELIKGGGGIACATGIIAREPQ